MKRRNVRTEGRDSEASEATREKPTQSEWSESQMIRTTPWSEALT